ncbi:MAG: LPS assembly lipoprotein LptE [Elusimicrobia bacterium]|nr:LPS assembly lipoprotein LptE [Elusimicrobiota bacterium]
MKKVLIFCMASFFVLAGCASMHNPAPQLLPEHVRKIYIRPFVNNTNQFGIETRLTNAVIEEFLRDGRLSVVNSPEEAHSMLVGEIRRYVLQPLTYDANMVARQFKLWVIVSVSLVDTLDDITLWREPGMEGIQIYADLSADPFGITEEQARERVWDQLSRRIVRRTVRGFGSETSVSRRRLQGME